MENAPASPKSDSSDQPDGWLALRRISRWYWGAVGVIALAALAQFFQAAPVTTPATVVSATLAPDVTLQIAYPRNVRPVLRAADKAPLALTLQGVGALTYTVALSTSAGLLFTDGSQQVVDPRAELTVNGCCQSSVVFYPQASSDAWHQQSVEVSAYATAAGALLPKTPTLTFTLYLEPVWWTWGRRALALFAELGLAVSVALALVGWAFEQQKRRQEKQFQLWQTELENAHRKCEHDLLAGVGRLQELARELNDHNHDRQWSAELDKIMERVVGAVTNPYSAQVAQCLAAVADRLIHHKTLTETELHTLHCLFDAPGIGDMDDNGIRCLRSHSDAPAPQPNDHAATILHAFKTLNSRDAQTDPDQLLAATHQLYQSFGRFPATSRLVICIIDEWYKVVATQNLPQRIIDEKLQPFQYLMHDPDLLHIPFSLRTSLYPELASKEWTYPWAPRHDAQRVTSYLKEYIGLKHQMVFSPFQVTWSLGTDDPRLPKIDSTRSNFLLFRDANDARCSAHLLFASLWGEAATELRSLDAAPDASLPGADAGHVIPFAVMLDLFLESQEDAQQEFAWLKQFARAVAERWLDLLALRPGIWFGLPNQMRQLLAEMFQLVARSEAEIRHRWSGLVHDRGCPSWHRVISQPAEAAGKRSRHIVDDILLRDEVCTDIAQRQGSVEPDTAMLETWLTLRPPHLTHTVLVVVTALSPDGAWSDATGQVFQHLIGRLQLHNVIVHALTIAEPPQPFSAFAFVNCQYKADELVALVDSSFQTDSEEFQTTSDNSTRQSKTRLLQRIVSQSDYLLIPDLEEALLFAAQGSASRLLFLIYAILLKRYNEVVANQSAENDEFRLRHSDIMDVVDRFIRRVALEQ